MARGTVNGSALNTILVNAGPITHGIGATSNILVASTLPISVRQASSAVLASYLTASGLARLRSPALASATASLFAVNVARRRIGMSSASILALSGAAAMRRRAQITSTQPIAFSGGGVLWWQFRQRAARGRIISVPLEHPSRIVTRRGA